MSPTFLHFEILAYATVYCPKEKKKTHLQTQNKLKKKKRYNVPKVAFIL